MDPTPRLVPIDVHALDREEGDLLAESPRVAPELAVASHDAVAGNDDRKRIGSHSLADRPRCASHPHFIGDVPIRHDSAVGDFGEPVIDASLKVGRSGEIERKMEALPPPVEILIELVQGDPERGVSVRIPVTVRDHLGRDAPNSSNSVAGDPDRDGSSGRVVKDA